MSSSVQTQWLTLTKVGLPLAAAALVVTACGSSSGSSAPSKAAAGSAASGTVVSTASGSAGTFLTDGSGKALYLWVADTANKSTCTGACASAWPPLTTAGTPTASGGAKASDLGTTTRSDGSMQVTYDGHPLYYFAGDSGAGQTSGQGSDGFGAKWWLVAPSGTAISGTGSGGASSSPAPAASTNTAGGGW